MADALGRLDEVIHPGALLLLGEVHGTAEYPAFCASLVEHVIAQHSDLELRVGLEISRSAQSRLDDHLGGTLDRAELLADPHWALPDGRGSVAVLGVVDRLCALRRGGAPLDIVAIDVPRFDAASRRPGDLGAEGFFAIYGDRDRAMADAVITTRLRAPRACTIVLVGNWHSRCGHRAPHAMGHYLLGEVPGLVALHGVDAGGTAWVITDRAQGPQAVAGYRRPPAEPIWWSRRLRPNGHHGWFDVGPLTASPPAAALE